MMEVNNYLEHELSSLEDHEVLILFKNGAESNKVNDYELINVYLMPYWFVKVELLQHLSKFELTTIIEKALKFSNIDIEVSEISIPDQMKLICYIRNSYMAIIEMEKHQFKSEPNPDAIIAGSQNFEVFGEYNAINALSSDVTKWDDIKRLPYEICFTKLLMNKVQGEYDKKYSEVLRNKNKKK